MPHRIEANPEVIGAAVAAALGGVIAAVLVPGAHDDHLRVGMILSSAVSLTAGLFGVYCAVRRLGPPAPAVIKRIEALQRPGAEPKPEAWPPTTSAIHKDFDPSPMEIRMTGSLKSIRDQAELGLFASDDEKAAHLAAIWSMAACDLDDDQGTVAH